MGTTDTIIRLGALQPALNHGAGRGRDFAPVIDGTTVIGHLCRHGEQDYRATLTTPGSAGCPCAHNRTANPVSSDGVDRAADHTDAHRYTSDLAALIAVARHHHQI
jgi:hypothetical protein